MVFKSIYSILQLKWMSRGWICAEVKMFSASSTVKCSLRVPYPYMYRLVKDSFTIH